MLFPGRTLLACWLAVVLTGTVVAHRHAAAAGHTHGFGWAALRGGTTPADLPLAHRHFVLLGIEFGAVPDHADGGAFVGIQSATGEVAASNIDARGIDLSPEHPVLVPDGPANPLTPPGANPVVPVSPRSDCPHISRARTGVLRS